MHNIMIRNLVVYAYKIPAIQLEMNNKMPNSWDWFDIDAKVEGAPTDDQIRLMCQALLRDRFNLKVHHESQLVDVYTLAVAKGGAKLALPSADDVLKLSLDGRPFPVAKGTAVGLLEADGTHAYGHGVTLAQLANFLTGPLQSPVTDGTRLSGTFDFTLFYTPDNFPPDRETVAPFLPAALKEQLGLTLEKSKAPLDMLVVDQISKPTPN
jgi:uncharacterized protein (TIGR03435 family)